MNPTETQIQSSILKWLKYQRGIKAIRVNTTGVPIRTKTGKLRLKKNEAKGMSDILAVYQGKAIFLEVKKPGGRVSKDQKSLLTEFANVGALCKVVYSLEEAISFINKIKGRNGFNQKL